MAYYRLPEKELRAYCEAVMGKYGFNEKQSRDIADILLTADLQGLESHGVQRLIRYHRGVKSGVIRPDAVPEVVHETPLSVVLDAHSAMGQIAAVDAMERAIAKAKQYGFGAAVVRNSNHFGVGGYYAMMAEREDMLGMCFTNTQAICVPTFGREVMLGTNPIAFAMPADPIPMLYDVATTVVPRGKLEVYAKQGKPMRRSAGPSMKTVRTPPMPSASSTTSTPRRAAAFSRSAAPAPRPARTRATVSR